MGNKLLTIVIVAYNSQSVLSECLDSIAQYNDIGDALEVVVVDNSLSNDLEEFIKSYVDSGLCSYIHNPTNGGFGQGNNVGVRATEAEILFFLNPDTILVEPIFDYIINEFKASDLTAAGFTLVDRDMKLNDTVGLLPEYNFVYLPRKVLYSVASKCSLLSKIIFPWGADFIVRRKDFMDAGMFDENMFLCNEEPDLLHRLNVQRVAIFPKKIIHLEGHTTVLHETRFKQWMITTEYYFAKHHKSYKLFLIIFLCRNAAKLGLRKLFRKDIGLQRAVHKLLSAELRRVL